MYDSLVIGTSPVSLLEAIHLAETGRKVRIIEREMSLGGAWRVHDCFGLQAVEVSPHLFVADPVVNEILTRKFKVELEVVDPRPEYRFWGPDLPRFKGVYPIQNQLGEELRTLISMARGSLRNTFMLPFDVLTGFKTYARARKLPIMYPKGGLARLLENAASILDDLGVEVSYGTQAKKIEWMPGSPGHQVVTTSAGQIRTKQVALPRIVDLDCFIHDGHTVPAYFQDKHTTHLCFKTRTTTKGQLRFLKITGSSFYELINDVTPYCVGDVADDVRIVACRCTRSRSFSDQDVNKYFDHLREIDYLPKDDKLLDYRVTQAEDRVLTYFMRPRLKPLFGDSLVFLGAGDLSITGAIREFNATRWSFV